MAPILRSWVLAFLCGGLACAGASERPLRVASLSTVLTEVAARVGGPAVVVQGVLGPGIDPHAFVPSPADVRQLADAEVILASGLDMEPYLDRLMASIGRTGAVVPVGDRLEHVLWASGSGSRRERDPHWWNSVEEMIAAVGIVRDALSRVRPADAAAFSANAASYRSDLERLKAWAAGEIERLPLDRRLLVTSHDAFGYFAQEWRFTVHPIAGVSTEAEADARSLARVIDLIRSEHIPAVFAESTVDPRIVQNLTEQTGVRLGPTLFGDGLGPAGSGAETYEAMYRSNVSAIVGALLGPRN